MDLKQIVSKKRSVDDLIQFVKTRTDAVPNYALLLGAGASVSSGIRSGSQLVEEWRREIFGQKWPGEKYDSDEAKTRLTKECSQWYSMNREYSSLFEKKFDLPRQRRMFVENEVAGRFPSIGYAYLIRLIEKNYFNTVFTTNFDDLLNEAFHQFSELRPIICAHDSSISSVTVTSKRPKIIKVHGDYLFDDIKSTVRETESLEENTKKKFIEFGKDHGLIVVGYGGHDRSVMDVLNYLLKHEEYLKHGIYWCLREQESHSEELIKLLWRERVYWVPIDGYDELVANLYRSCIGNALPISTALFSEKPKYILSKFCSSEVLSKSNSPVIFSDLSRLKEELERDALFESYRPFTDIDDERPTKSKVSDSERIKLMAIRKSIMDQDFSVAQASLESELSGSISDDFRTLLLEEKLSLERSRGDGAAALQTVEELIAEDPNHAGLYVRRAALESSLERKLTSIDKALSIDPYFSLAYRRKAELLEEEMARSQGGQAQSKCKEIIAAYESALRVYPSMSNPAWSAYLEFLLSGWVDRAESSQRIAELLEAASGIDAYAGPTLNLLIKEAVGSNRSASEKDLILAKISDAIGRQSKASVKDFQLQYVQGLHAFERNSDVMAEVQKYDADDGWKDNWNYKLLRAEIYADLEGNISGAINLLSGAQRIRGESRCVQRLVLYLCYAGKVEEAKRVLEECRYLSHEERQGARLEIWSAEGLHEKAAQKYAELFKAGNASNIDGWTHELLLAERFSEAEEVAKSFLRNNNYSIQFEVAIVNLELAMLRQRKNVDKPRLQRLLQRTDLAPAVRGGICYLLDDKVGAGKHLAEAIKKAHTNIYVVRNWALFAPPKDRNWLDGTIGKLRLVVASESVDAGVVAA